MYLLRPCRGFADPHLCELHELRSVYTLDDLADFHEILDLRQAVFDRIKNLRETERAVQEVKKWR